MKTLFITILVATTLSACGFMTPVKQYAGDVQDPPRIVVVKGYVGNPFSDEYHVTITGYKKIESSGLGEQKAFGIPGFTDYPNEIHVLAGAYSVQVYCFKGFSSYRPSTSLQLQVGKTYLLKCEMRNGQAIIDANASPTE